MLYLDAQSVETRVEFPRLCAEISFAYENGHARAASCPEKSVLMPDGSPGIFMTLPALDTLREIFAVKIGTFYPREPGDTRPTIHADVMVYSAATGEPLARIDGAAVTAVKCAAVSAVVTDRCLSAEAATAAIIGTGVQAAEQVRALAHIRPVWSLRLYGRTRVNLETFAESIRRKHPFWAVSLHSSIEDAVLGASVIATTTSSNRPLSRFEQLAPDVHINCMGAHDAEGRELPADVLETAQLIVEDRPTAIREAGLIHEKAQDLTEFFQIREDQLRARRTIFSSTGHAYLDLLAAAHILGKGISLYPWERSADHQPKADVPADRYC